MAWDIAISNLGDLTILSNHDVAGKSGIDLIEQRILLRLKVWRGSWLYDDDLTLGSQLHRLVSMPLVQAVRAAQAYVNEALREMTEISVDDVQVQQNGSGLSIVVNYHVVSDDISPRHDITGSVELAIPVGGGI